MKVMLRRRSENLCDHLKDVVCRLINVMDLPVVKKYTYFNVRDLGSNPKIQIVPIFLKLHPLCVMCDPCMKKEVSMNFPEKRPTTGYFLSPFAGSKERLRKLKNSLSFG